MKQLLALLVLAFLLVSSAFAAEEKKVCVDRLGKDGKVVKGKDGKAQQDCKTIKVHKKLEGTEVPTKK